MRRRTSRSELEIGERERMVELSYKLVKPENLGKLFLFQDLLGRGLKAWKKKH